MELHPTFWHIISSVLSVTIASILIFALVRYISMRTKSNQEKQILSSVATSLKRGMSMEEVESKYGHFDNIEMVGNLNKDWRECYLGKENSVFVTLLFINNVLKTWKLVA